jgi:hypothetical protein
MAKRQKKRKCADAGMEEIVQQVPRPLSGNRAVTDVCSSKHAPPSAPQQVSARNPLAAPPDSVPASASEKWTSTRDTGASLDMPHGCERPRWYTPVTRRVLSARKKVAVCQMPSMDQGNSASSATAGSDLPKDLHPCQSQWDMRKVPSGRSLQDSRLDEIALADTSNMPSKRRRLLAPPMSEGELDTPASLARQETQVGSFWTEGLVAIGEQMLEERGPSDRIAEAGFKDCEAVRSSAHSSWSLASWVPFWKRT